MSTTIVRTSTTQTIASPRNTGSDRKLSGKKTACSITSDHMTPNEVINRQFGRPRPNGDVLYVQHEPAAGIAQHGSMAQTRRQNPQHRRHRRQGSRLGDRRSDFRRQSRNNHASERPGSPRSRPTTTTSSSIRSAIRGTGRATSTSPASACHRRPPSSTPLEDFLVELEEIEDATNLTFIPGWDHNIGESLDDGSGDTPMTRHRLLRMLRN